MSYGLASDKDAGRVWICGTFSDRMKLTVGGESGDEQTAVELSVPQDTGGHTDTYVLGIDHDGLHEKHWVFAGEGRETLIDAAVRGDKLAIIGYQVAASDTVPGKITFPLKSGGQTTFTNTKSDDDAFIAVLDTTVNAGANAVEWAASHINTFETKFFGVDVDSTGSAVVVGHSCYEDTSTTIGSDENQGCGTWSYSAQCAVDKPCYTGSDVDPETGLAHTCAAKPAAPPPPIICDAIVKKYDSTGGVAAEFAITSLVDGGDNSLWGVKLDEANAAIFVTGDIRGVDKDFGGACGKVSSVQPGQDSMIVVRFDLDLQCEWVKVIGSTASGARDRGWDLTHHGDFVYAVGSNRGEGSRNGGLYLGTNSGHLVKLRKDTGSTSWGVDLPSSRGCDVNADGTAIYLMGMFSGSAEFGVTGDQDVRLMSRGSTDLFVAKVDAATGSGVWAMDAGGSGMEYPWMLEVGKHDDVFIAGLTQSPDLHFGQDTDTASLLDGVSSMFITKLDSTETMPTCMSDCDTVKAHHCFIHNVCYKEGEAAPYAYAGCLTCQPAVSQSSWSHDSTKGCYIDGKCVGSGDYKSLSAGGASVCELCEPASLETQWRVLSGYAVVGETCQKLEDVQCGLVGVRSKWCTGQPPCLAPADGVCKNAPTCPEGSTFQPSHQACSETRPCLTSSGAECIDANPVEPDCGEWSYSPIGCHAKYHEGWLRQPKPCYDWRHNEHECKAPQPVIAVNPIAQPLAKHYVDFTMHLVGLEVTEFNNIRQQLYKEAIAEAAGVQVLKVFILQVEEVSGRRRLLGTAMDVRTRVETDTKANAESLVAKLDLPSIGTNLREKGLGVAASFVILPTADGAEAPDDDDADDDNGGLSSVAVAMITLASCAVVGGVAFGGYVAYQRSHGGSTELPNIATGLNVFKTGEVENVAKTGEGGV
eukprot:CAMPEP_0196716646 /NCGR_PEP_ID=MMETSP1091-20130531/59_1 /TAXON_ID=302021 /ORGANISM="Rhodomonas sp., Strain CCMP768" /LENGTH=925 /DNA_ID=CAMNT_0042056761 /DNA_START=332 /DNA_END=3109 /DNA_ORIENTATION=-